MSHTRLASPTQQPTLTIRLQLNPDFDRGFPRVAWQEMTMNGVIVIAIANRYHTKNETIDTLFFAVPRLVI